MLIHRGIRAALLAWAAGTALVLTGCAATADPADSASVVTTTSASSTTSVRVESVADACLSYNGVGPTVDEFKDAYLAFTAEYYVTDNAGSLADRHEQATQMFVESPDGIRPSIQSVFERVPEGGATRYTNWTCTKIPGEIDQPTIQSAGAEMGNPALRLFGGLLTCVDAEVSESVDKLSQVNAVTVEMLCPDAQERETGQR